MNLARRCHRSLLTALKALIVGLCIVTHVAAQTSTVTYFHNDLAGFPVAASDSSGTIIWRESYRPYGERLTNASTSQDNSQWYTGHRQDAESGLVYMGARHYDPLIGRFLSIDPAPFTEGNPHSFNRYAYANNNPVKFVDPDGREIVSANARNNEALSNMINTLALGNFAFDANNRLRLMDAAGDSSKFSAEYQSRLIEAINSPSKISLEIKSTFTVYGVEKDVDAVSVGGGVTLSWQAGGSQTVVISGNANTSLKNAKGGQLRDTPADILMHELVGHAIPSIVGGGTGNAVKNENRVRAQVPGSGQRATDAGHNE
jgi:RHS repeat-associated protein